MLELHQRDSNHPKVMDSAMYWARASVRGRLRRGDLHIRNATTGTANVFGSDSRMVGELLSACVLLEIERGDLRTAIASARRSIAIYLERQEPGTPDHAARVRLLGQALLLSGATHAAAERLDEAVRLSVVAKSTSGMLHSRTHLGLALAYLGRFDEAESHLRQTLDKAGPLNMRARHLAMRNLGTSLRLQGRYRESLEWLEKAMVAAAIHHNHRGDLAQGLLEAGLARLELGELDTARQLFTKAEALFRDVHRITPRPRAPTCWSAWRASTSSARTTPVRWSLRRKPTSSGVTSIRTTAGRVKRRSGWVARIWRWAATLKRLKPWRAEESALAFPYRRGREAPSAGRGREALTALQNHPGRSF